MELSPAGFEAMLLDLSMMDRKTGTGYLRLLSYLRRFGSVPSDDRSFASILGVTVRYLRERAWPLLEDRVVLSDDGRRYFDPDITPARPRRAAGAPGPVEKSKQHQTAANIRHARTRMQKDATAHALGMRPHAETHGNSMRDASKTHAEIDANACPDASPDASDAYASSRAPSLSLSSPSFSQPSQIPGESEEGRKQEREGARASADAPAHAESCDPHANGHAPAHAESCDPHANGHASAAASARRSSRRSARPSVVGSRITADWQPEPADRLEAQKRGLDPDETATAFRDYYLGKSGALSPDWSARFRSWCRREAAPSRQHHLTMAVRGNKPQKPPSNGYDALVLRDGFSGGYRGGRVIDAKADPAPGNPVLDFLASEAKKNAG
jgi:hypothetical protein